MTERKAGATPSSITENKAGATPSSITESKAGATSSSRIESKAGTTPSSITERKAGATPSSITERKAGATPSRVTERKAGATPSSITEREAGATPSRVIEREAGATPSKVTGTESDTTPSSETTRDVYARPPRKCEINDAATSSRIGETTSRTTGPEKTQKRVSWMPSSSEDESEEDEGEERLQEATWELSLEGWCPPDPEEESDYAVLPQVKQAIDITMGDRTALVNPETLVHTVTGPPPNPEASKGYTSREVVKELGMGVDAIPNNSVTTKDVVGMDEMVEAASLDNRNFIRVIIGGEAYLALLDPGATVSLVGPKILEKYRDRLQETLDK